MAGSFYDFDWDPTKARANLKKHRVSFRLATSIFRDALALTTYDDEHSSHHEERWVTLGRAESGQFLVVVHTFEIMEENERRIRIISAREADRDERRVYEDIVR